MTLETQSRACHFKCYIKLSKYSFYQLLLKYPKVYTKESVHCNCSYAKCTKQQFSYNEGY